MKFFNKVVGFVVLLLAGFALAAPAKDVRWSCSRAKAWGDAQPWYCGVNYDPVLGRQPEPLEGGPLPRRLHALSCERNRDFEEDDFGSGEIEVRRTSPDVSLNG